MGVKETKTLVMGPALVFQSRCKLDQDLLYDTLERGGSSWSGITSYSQCDLDLMITKGTRVNPVRETWRL